MSVHRMKTEAVANRRYFIGGSDARIIMGNDEAALIALPSWTAQPLLRASRTASQHQNPA